MTKVFKVNAVVYTSNIQKHLVDAILLHARREYDRVIKCIYVLGYADNKTLRQFVQQALNRGEAYHQLRRAIASVNGNQFLGGNDYQIDQWNDLCEVNSQLCNLL